MNTRNSRIFRQFVTIFLFLIGIALVFAAPSSFNEPFIASLGIAFVVAGFTGFIRVSLTLKLELDEIGEEIARSVHEKLQNDLLSKDDIEKIGQETVDNIHSKLKEDPPFSRVEVDKIGQEIVDNIHSKLKKDPPLGSGGIFRIARRRDNFEGYHAWATFREPGSLVFVGRSILNRINADFLSHKNIRRSAAEVIIEKLQWGGTIRILFFDPRSDLLKRLAEEEGQEPKDFLTDISQSLDVVKQINDGLNIAIKENPDLKPEIYIGIYNKIPYFAYHKDKERTVIGFYSISKGFTNEAFLVNDRPTNRFFEKYIEALFQHSEFLLKWEFNKLHFASTLFQQCCNATIETR